MSYDDNDDYNEGDDSQAIAPQQPAQAFDARNTRSSRGGLGCAIAGVVLVLVIVLIGIALLLPPFLLGDRLFNKPFAALSQQTPGTALNGLTLSLAPGTSSNGFGVRLQSVAPEVFTGQKAASVDDATWIRMAHAALPSSLTLISPVYQIETQGTAPSAVSLTVALPPNSDSTKVDLYRYDVQDNHWQFIPAHPTADRAAMVAQVTTMPDRVALFEAGRLVPVIGTTVDAGQSLTPNAAQVANVIHPAGLQPNASGALQGVLPAGIGTAKGYAIVPVIRNFTDPAALDVATITTLMQNSALRAAHIVRLIEFASSKPYQGIAIDYRGLAADQRNNFAAFITALADKLHNANLTLTVVVPFPAQANNAFDTGAYDWQAIGAAVDSLQVLLPIDPHAYADDGPVSQGLRWAVGEVNRARLQLAFSLLSVQETAGSFAPVAYTDALAPLGQVAVKPNGVLAPGTEVAANLNGYTAQFVALDSSGTPAVKYFAPDGSLAGTMWLTSGSVIARRLAQINAYNVAGVVAFDLISPGISGDANDALAAYKVNQPADAQPSTLALRWTVMSQGKLVAQASAVPGTPFVYKPDNSSDSVQINAEIVGARGTFGPVNVRVATATPTPTITPTSTSTPTPTRTPTFTRTPTEIGAGTTAP